MKATVEELMTLLADLTNWGDQSLSVHVGYKRARVQTAQDESHLDENDKGFTVSTTICGDYKDSRVSSEGPTLEKALWNLANEISAVCHSRLKRWTERKEKVEEALQAFDKRMEIRDVG